MNDGRPRGGGQNEAAIGEPCEGRSQTLAVTFLAAERGHGSFAFPRETSAIPEIEFKPRGTAEMQIDGLATLAGDGGSDEVFSHD